MSFLDFLRIASIAGALFCAGAYVYAFVLRSKGNRRLHTASLLCSGVALANLPVLLSADIGGLSVVATTNVVVFVLLSTVFQSLSAFRGRTADRGERRAGEAASFGPPNVDIRRAA